MRLAPLLIVSLLSLLHLALSECPAGWAPSATVFGKCYAFTQWNTSVESVYGQFVFPCRQLIYGADIAAIGNGFENQEIASILMAKNLSSATIGAVKFNQEQVWLSAAGYTTYTNFQSSYYSSQYTNILKNGTWESWYDRSPQQALCQYYPDDQTKWPTSADCPAGWLPSAASPEKCIQYAQTPDNFYHAVNVCQSLGAEILSMKSGLDGYEFSGYFPGNYWSNYGRLGSNSNWHWMGSHPTNYTPQLYNSNNNGDQCSYFYSNNYLQISNCSSNSPRDRQYLSAVCEIYPPAKPTPAPQLCPDSWRASSTVDWKCYAAISQDVLFDKGRQLCQILHDDADVLAITDDRELAQLYQDSSADALQIYWLALQQNQAGQWNWTSTRGGPIDAWAPGQPDESIKVPACGALHGDHYYAFDCQTTRQKVFCQLFV